MALDKITTGIIADDVSISTSGAITTTGAFTSVGIDDNASGATAITIDANENVGIGVTNPSDFNDSINNLVVGSIASGAHGITIATHSTSTGYLSFADGATTVADEYRGLIEYDHSVNTMHLRTDASQRLTIDSSGNVGIGVTPRTDWRDTRTGLQIGPRTTLWGESGNNNSVFGHNVYETSSGYAGIVNGACNFHLLSAGEWDYRNGTNSAGAGGTVTMTTRLKVATDGRVWIGPNNSNGPWGDNTGSGTIRIRAGLSSGENNNIAISSPTTLGYAMIYLNAIDGANDHRFLQFYHDGGVSAGTISLNGTSNVSYDTSSDYRLKENVEPLTGSVARLKNIKPKKYNFITEPDRECEGFLAHELQEYVPRAVSGVKDQMWPEVLYTDEDELPEGKKIGDVKEEAKINPQGVDFGRLTPLLVGALQEIVTRVEALEAA